MRNHDNGFEAAEDEDREGERQARRLSDEDLRWFASLRTRTVYEERETVRRGLVLVAQG